MSSPPVSELLIEAPANRHFAQLHRDPGALTDAVTLYLQTGLRRGNGVVVIASPEHTDLFLARLREDEVDPGAFLKSGQLELHDAELTLRKFMRNDMPDWEDFRHAMASIFERVRAFGRGRRPAKAGTGNRSWQEGNQNPAILSGASWNESGRLTPLPLFSASLPA